MIRKIVQIDQEKCNGCGLCAEACHEQAIQMVAGKAQLIKDDYCDGLGDCLPACPADAITIVEREAAAYDEAAVKARQEASKIVATKAAAPVFQCPGQQARALRKTIVTPQNTPADSGTNQDNRVSQPAVAMDSQLQNWPVQIQLLPITAPFYQGKKLLIAADCTAYAYGNFHNRFVKNHITAIACPKLDPVDYTEKLTAILAQNDITAVDIVRMEVPCCGGIVHYAQEALKNCGKMIPWQITTISCNGEIISD